MRMTMKNGKKGYDGSGNSQRGLGGKGDHQTEDNARKRNTPFDAGHWNTQDAQSATERHHYGEDQRQNPDRRRAKKSAPQSHRYHRHNVIKPG